MNLSSTIDDIQNELLTSHFNKSGKVPGVLLTVMYSGASIIAYGVVRLIEYVKKQITADTASPEMVEVHAKIRGLSPVSGETTEDLLGRYLDDIQNPRSGGNKRDWERWAEECSFYHDTVPGSEWTESVVSATAFENARGPGTVNVVIVSDRTETGFEGIATSDLISEVTDHLEDKRPLGVWDFLVYPASHELVDVDIDIAADNFQIVASDIVNQINSYLQTLKPGTSLSLLSLYGIVEQCGASSAVINDPTGDVATDDGPDTYSRIWPGNTIAVGEL